MKAFRRIFGYIWPQWPRVIIVVLSAMVVAALLSVSFMTVIPLLKVMIGNEGLHGWIDRKGCKWKYGLVISIPETIGTGYTSAAGQGALGLLVSDVKDNSLAEKAGIKPLDRITAAQDHTPSGTKQQDVAKILEKLATTRQAIITVEVRRINEKGVFQKLKLQLHSPYDNSYINGLGWSWSDRAALAIKTGLTERLEWAVGFLPREQTLANRTKAVLFIILAVAVLTLVRCVAKFYQSYLAEKVVQVAVNRMREDTFGHALCLPMGFFVTERPSDTVSRIVRDTSVMGNAIKILLGKALREPLNALFMLGFAMILNWQLTLIFLCAAPLILGMLAIFGKKMKKATRKSLMASSQMLAKLQEAMAALDVVKVYNTQEYERQAFKKINDRLLKQQLKISKVDAATLPVLEVLGMAAGSIALIIGVQWVTKNRMDGSEFLGLLILLGASAESVRKTSKIWNRVQEATAAAERVFGVMDQPIEKDPPHAVELGPLRNSIEFVDVFFTYPGKREPVLKGINLAVPAGHNVAIVGANGSGKTTLAKLIPRFYDPDKGRILIDGRDIRDVTLYSLRRQIGMVTQNVVTFNDTIAANIAYGKPDATLEEIIAAAKRAYAHEFISLLPDGYDTVIGEHGVGLSGGQLQRIVIARAILRNPAILIFDEATSQVDAESEAKIHNAIEQIMQDRTSFIIAHRFSTVITADVIVVLDNGRIVDQGQHDELIQRCPVYQGLYETQLVKA